MSSPPAPPIVNSGESRTFTLSVLRRSIFPSSVGIYLFGYYDKVQRTTSRLRRLYDFTTSRLAI
jgi:hypothetical protein